MASTTSLGVLCLIFIYFLGTGRWVKEVAIGYKIPDDPLPKLTRELKRKAFPAALFAMQHGLTGWGELPMAGSARRS